MTSIFNKGDLLPEFILEGINELGETKKYSNKDFIGTPLVLYFYPKDNTPGCTREACNFNALLPQIMGKGNIVGVSADSIASHKKFQTQYALKFPLLSDPEATLATSLGAIKDNFLQGILSKKIIRATFVFNNTAELVKAWQSVSVDGHDVEVLQILNTIIN